MTHRALLRRSLLVPAVFVVVSACSKAPPEPIGQVPERRQDPVPSAAISARVPHGDATVSHDSSQAGVAVPHALASGASSASLAPVATGKVVQQGGNDPLKGRFTLADATKDLPGTGALLASIETNKGKLECKLLADKAPNTVANFIGLARGTRPWKDPSGNWVAKPAYDGTTFHRVIRGFMIQGGDAKGNGSGEPGYVIPDEVWTGAKHDRAGLLCMANRGPDTNGAQFFITDAAAAHLDGGYTIFGECEPVSVVNAIARVEVDGERPRTPVVIQSVRVQRVPAAKK
jgi:peptidyl-prolyl cis-trans isomerase A (cyclophilin A)